MKDILLTILEAVIAVVVPIVATSFCNFLKQRTTESEAKKTQLTLNNAANCVFDAVTYINQVMVDSLKAKGMFDEEKQKEAFKEAYEIALNSISEEAKICIDETFGSFEEWLNVKIEAAVNKAKLLF